MFEQFKDKMSLEQIAMAMPICIKCFDWHAMTVKEREKFATMYNKWAEANDLTERIDPSFYS
jgi:hypothetical protein